MNEEIAVLDKAPEIVYSKLHKRIKEYLMFTLNGELKYAATDVLIPSDNTTISVMPDM